MKNIKNILILPCIVALLAACSSTQSQSVRRTATRGDPIVKTGPNRDVEQLWPLVTAGEKDAAATSGTAQYTEQRIDGQRTREAALSEVGERGQGSASVVGSGATVSRESGGLETVEQADIELRKEELVVGKREVSNGGVLVRTIVQTENVSQPINLRREEYVIERIPANDARNRSDAGTSATNAFLGREIYLPLMREEPVTSKRTVLIENVKVGKLIETDRQTITRPVRTEDVEIVKNPNLSEARFSSVPRRSAASGGRESAQVEAPARGETSADTLKLAKEEFIVGKRDVDNGGVFLQKVVRTQDASQPVELRREEFTIDRTPLQNQPIGNADFREREIKINLTREEAVAGTRTYLAETIRVRKQIETDNQTVAGTVRKETVEIVKNSGQPVTGQGGTGSSIQSGTSSFSESGRPAKSEIKVENGNDQGVSNRVRTALTQDCPDINVTTLDGVVKLSGTVRSESEKERIGEQVKKMSGVRSIKNELQVAGKVE